MAYFIALLTYSHSDVDLSFFGTLVFTVCFLAVTIKAAVDTYHWTWIMFDDTINVLVVNIIAMKHCPPPDCKYFNSRFFHYFPLFPATSASGARSSGTFLCCAFTAALSVFLGSRRAACIGSSTSSSHRCCIGLRCR